MKSLNSTDAEDRRTTLKTLSGISQGNSEISGQAEVALAQLICDILAPLCILYVRSELLLHRTTHPTQPFTSPFHPPKVIHIISYVLVCYVMFHYLQFFIHLMIHF